MSPHELEEFLTETFRGLCARAQVHLEEAELESIETACATLGGDAKTAGSAVALQMIVTFHRGAENPPKEESKVSEIKALDKTAQEQVSEDAQALQRGEITREEYLERRMEAQLEELKLSRLLPPEKLDLLRQIMREELFDSPAFDACLDRLTEKEPSSR